MAKNKQEVRDFLNSLVGQRVNSKAGVYNGQCVTLIKALLEFLGAPNPYAARGNAKDVGDTLVRQGIAKNGGGWLNVCVNRDMGNIYEPSLGRTVNYGHIWLDILNEFNLEQNGSQALRTTKNTRPISQAQQIVNLDQYIKADAPAKPTPPKEDNMPVKVTLPIARLLSYGLEQRSGSLRRILGREHKSAVDGTYDQNIKWMVGRDLDLNLLNEIYNQKFVNDKRVEVSNLADQMVEFYKVFKSPKEAIEIVEKLKQGATAEEVIALNKIKAIVDELEKDKK